MNYAVKHYGLPSNPCSITGSIGKLKTKEMQISLVDKLVSSFAPLLTGFAFAAIGFKDVLPDATTTLADLNAPGSVYQNINIDAIPFVTLSLAFGVVIIGLLCNVVALKFYPLTKEYMAQIEDEIAAIKAKAAQEA